MSSPREFKIDADKIMNNITVSSSLRERTLKGLHSKKAKGPALKLIPAIGLAAALMLVTIPGSPFSMFGRTPGSTANPDDTPGIMMVDPAKTSIQGDPNMAKSSLLLKNLEEAKEYLDGAVLTPSYIPDGFELDTIQAVSSNSGIVDSIYLAYTFENRTFVISMEKDKEWKDFSSYRDVDINGVNGHIKSGDPGQELTELRWFKDNVLYSIDGSLSREQALLIAESLK